MLLPQNPSQLAKTVNCTEKLISAVNCLFHETMHLIQSAMKGQSQNQLLLDQRKGHITASMFHWVMMRMNNYSHDQSVSMDSLLKKLCGYSDNPTDIPALNYVGIWRQKPLKSTRHYVHLELIWLLCKKKCGLSIDKNDQFIGASLDGIIVCHNH